MTSTFGTTKIDKIQLSYPKTLIPEEIRGNIDAKVNKYFPDKISFNKAGNIFYRITLTKLVINKRKGTAHNLQMPSQELLLQAFEDITINNRILQENVKDTVIHLAKDIILDKPVNNYIMMLGNLSYSRLSPEIIESDGFQYSLYLTPNHAIDSSGKNIKSSILIYNKPEEFYRKYGTYICKLLEPLSPTDVEKVGSAYNPSNNTLDLSKINLMRIEIEIKSTKKLQPIINLLTNEESTLTASVLIKSLKEKLLYTAVEKIFTQKLKESVFSAEQTFETATQGINDVRKLACDILSKSDIYFYSAIADELGLESEFSEYARIIRKIIPDSDLYTELYHKLFLNSDSREYPVFTELFESGCNSYSFDYLKDFILAYEVPIWDDS